MDICLVVKNLFLSRENRILTTNLNLNISAAQCVQLQGVNGCGKTSLLMSLLGLITIEKGEILWYGNSITNINDAFKTHLHWCAEKLALKNLLTIEQNIYWQLKLSANKFNIKAFKECLQQLSLELYADELIENLSQGQRKKVALMKLYLDKRLVWLLDEPFNALDTTSTTTLARWINNHVATGGLVIFTNHDNNPPNLIVNQFINME